MNDQQQHVEIVRTFDAPIESVWEMWTDATRFRSWYGPAGFSLPVAEMDVRAGGTRKICMEMATPERTMTMWFAGTYKEVSPPTRLHYTEAMCDADGTPLSPQSMGMPEGTPDVTEVIVDLRPLGSTTEVTMAHVGVPAGSPGEGGWRQALDKLAATLADT